VFWHAIPQTPVNWWNLFDMYLPPLSSCRALIWCPNWVLAYALKFLKACSTSDFLLIGNMQVVIDESHPVPITCEGEVVHILDIKMN